MRVSNRDPVSDKGLIELSRALKILQRVAIAVGAERDQATVVQLITDAGCELCGAEFGAFFYNVEEPTGDSYMLYTLSGLSANRFDDYPMPRKTEVFGPTFRGEGVVRSGDITQDPRYGQCEPFCGMPPEHPPVRSYLAVPVTARSGKVLGGLFFGNSEPDVFKEESEEVIRALAAQAAVSIENANLHDALQRDIVALQKADATDRLLASIVQSSDDAIISKTLQGEIRTWNVGAELMFGYTAEEAIGQPVTMLFPPGHLNEETQIIGRIIRGERVQHYETIRRRKDGSLIDLSLTISPILDAEGNIVGASKIARDISRRKADEEALRLANAALEESRAQLETTVSERTASLREAVAQMEEFSYTVSHDLQAPLRAMSSHSHILAEDYAHLFENEPDAWYSVQRIAENSRRLGRMVRDVLTYGRVARGDLVLEEVSLDDLLGETISLNPLLQEPAATIEIQPLGTVIAHESFLLQAVTNLMNNAVKFVEPGKKPHVRVWGEHKDATYTLFIQDNGIGIDPKHQTRLFSMFERIHPDLPYEGTGVGLAIVKRAMERMGGNVGMTSNGVDGSRFWLQIPAGGSDA